MSPARDAEKCLWFVGKFKKLLRRVYRNYVVLFSMTPYMGLALTVKYMCIIVLGGLGSLFGSLAGGVILGITESIVGYYFGSDWSPTVAYFALVLILLLRPQGLFGRK